MLDRFVDKDRTLYFSGAPDPTESYLWRVKDGGPPEKISTGAAAPAVEVPVAVSKQGGLIVAMSQTDTTMSSSTGVALHCAPPLGSAR